MKDSQKEEYLLCLGRSLKHMTISINAMKESLAGYRDPVVTKLAEAQSVLHNKLTERYQILNKEFTNEGGDDADS